MDVSQIMPVALILALVLVALPVFIGRLTGKSPMEVLFGRRINNSLFGGKSEENSVQSKSGGAKGKQGKERNGNKNDLLDTVSSLLAFSRRNHFCLVVPGTVEADGEKATMTAVLVTRSQAIGFNCFGFGGTVEGKSGQQDWTQTIQGERKQFESPVKRNEGQKKILKAAMTKVGYPDIPVTVLGIFTNPGVKMVGCAGSGCFTRKGVIDELGRDVYMQDKGIDPLQVGTDLHKAVAVPPKAEKAGKGKKKNR